MVSVRSVVCAHFVSDNFLPMFADVGTFWQMVCIKLIGVWRSCPALFGLKVGAKSMENIAYLHNSICIYVYMYTYTYLFIYVNIYTLHTYLFTHIQMCDRTYISICILL